jgi:hypothetical protein
MVYCPVSIVPCALKVCESYFHPAGGLEVGVAVAVGVVVEVFCAGVAVGLDSLFDGVEVLPELGDEVKLAEGEVSAREIDGDGLVVVILVL